MSSHYTTEPPPTASVLLHTTAGPIQISLFAAQTPLTSRNFIQHILDGYYDSTTFHRVVPGFVIQGGDPTGTGEGGESIYEDREFELNPRTGEKMVFGDELHSRLRFNRRGLVGMAKMGESIYGSQFFITLADVRAQLDRKCTMFGRVEGDGIYNVARIAEADNAEGTERPMYPFKITGAEVLEMPKGEPWAGMKKRERVAKRTVPEDEEAKPRKKAKTKKKGKALLSFGGEEADEDVVPATQPKAKFNTSLISRAATQEAVSMAGQSEPSSNKIKRRPREKQSDQDYNVGDAEQKLSHDKKLTRKRPSPTPPPRSPLQQPNPASNSPGSHRRKPSFHDPTTQLPPKDPEFPSRSPSRSASASPKPPSKSSLSTSALNAEIAALKASMRRTVPTAPEPTRKKSALEQMIPEASIRGRKRPKPGTSSKNDSSALKILNAFKARLEGADRAHASPPKGTMTNGVNGTFRSQANTKPAQEDNAAAAADEDDEEATLCDLHFIANCQSCSKWDDNNNPYDPSPQEHPHNDNDDNANASEEEGGGGGGTDWMSHALSFEKDRLGKDLSWKKKNEDELVVIDPREKEREISGVGKRGKKGEREWGGRGR